MPSPDPLNAPTPQERLAALRVIAAEQPRLSVSAATGARSEVSAGGVREVNCHVHTIYSFSPYSPAAAAARANAAGLAAVGIMDHDSIAGAAEMREAGRILGIATTAGMELRVSAEGTALEGKKINNPDSISNLYMMFHGIAARRDAVVGAFLRPIQAARQKRLRRMMEKLNTLLPAYALAPLDWDRDVRDASQAATGGAVTERHLLFAVARAIVAATGPGAHLVHFVQGTLGIALPPRLSAWLSDEGNDALLFDLLGVLKSSFLSKVFIQPDGEECIPVTSAVRFAEEIGAIPCYGYLGDVTDSPTGDKKAERFEDSYLEELFVEVKRLGFKAIAYMPPRNTLKQLRRVQELCARHGLMEISGVDINSPRQSFNCPELMRPEFSHLIAATWALIAHEKLSDAADRYGLFHPGNPLAALPLQERIAAYAAVGESLDPTDLRPAAEHPLVASWGRQ